MIAYARIRVIVAAVVVMAALANGARAEAPTTAVVSDAMRGGLIDSSLVPHPGTNVPWGRAAGVVDAPVDEVMEVLRNYGSYKEFMPNFEASRVLSQRGSAALVYMQVSILHGAARIWVEMKLKERTMQGETRTIEAIMTKGNVTRFEALWQVTPIDNQHSVVAFQILVDPGLPVPSSLVNSENQKNSRKAFVALRARVLAHKRAAFAAARDVTATTH